MLQVLGHGGKVSSRKGLGGYRPGSIAGHRIWNGSKRCIHS
jgi:hypothetical protein